MVANEGDSTSVDDGSMKVSRKCSVLLRVKIGRIVIRQEIGENELISIIYKSIRGFHLMSISRQLLVSID